MSGNVLTFFMWQWQTHFGISAQDDAETIFGRLDPRLDPNVFLIGVLREGRPDRHPICLEPEDCGCVVGDFVDIETVAATNAASDPARQVLHSHPSAQQAHEERIPRHAMRDALLQIFDTSPKAATRASDVSWPVRVEGYWVCVVLQLRRDAVERYASLARDRTEDDYIIQRSLTEAVAAEFLNWNAQEMSKPDARGRSFDRDAGEFIRAAGRDLMYTPAGPGRNFDGLHGLFAAANDISAMRYEGGEGRGGIVIARRDHPNVEPVVRLAVPVPVRQHRAVRKVLEMTFPDLSLLSDSAVIYALGRPAGGYDADREDLFVIAVVAHHTWDLVHAGRVLMRVSYSEPALPRQRLDKARFKSDLGRVFQGLGAAQAEYLWRLTSAAMEQRDGTMLVVAADAAAEAARLRDQCMSVEPMTLEPSTLRLVSAIDGAVLVDPDGRCHAIGVILDGVARPGQGSPSRGARYNSAVRYVEGNGLERGPCMAVIVSEDGSVDLVPDLRPTVRRVEIEQRLDALRAISATAGRVDVGRFNKAMGWLTRHEFYLSASACDEVNELRGQIEPRLRGQVNMTFVYQDLAPHPDMNDSYLAE